MKQLLLLICISFSTYSLAQNLDDKYGDDVQTIDAIIDAYYDVISGKSTEPWEFERDKYIHSNNALIIKINTEGTVDEHSLEAEYIPILSTPREDLYERELNRIVHQYENMALVWSTFERWIDEETPTDVRGMSSILLYYSEGRWWIASWISQMETENPIPVDYLGY